VKLFAKALATLAGPNSHSAMNLKKQVLGCFSMVRVADDASAIAKRNVKIVHEHNGLCNPNVENQI
jgi:hypothetical protein